MSFAEGAIGDGPRPLRDLFWGADADEPEEERPDDLRHVEGPVEGAVGLAWSPPCKKDQAKGAMKVSERFLAQDNCFAVSPDEALYWFLGGQDWTDERLSLLDACLARMTYFGRAESITSIERVPEAPSGIVINCELVDRRDRGAVPVLCVNGDMTAVIASDETALRSATVPPGAIWRYAVRPARPAARRLPIRRTHKSTSLIQFAIGATVEPPISAITTITGRLRGRVLREAFTELNDGVVTSWREAHPDLRARVADLAGKDAAAEPLKGHSHARYLLWCDGDGRATRLLVHRARPFEPWEHDAILRAAQLPLGWSQGKSEGWTLRLVPMDSAVPPPAGFDGARSRWWTSVPPFRSGQALPRQPRAAERSKALENKSTTSWLIEAGRRRRSRP